MKCDDCGQKIPKGSQVVEFGDGGIYEINICMDCNNKLPEYDDDEE